MSKFKEILFAFDWDELGRKVLSNLANSNPVIFAKIVENFKN